MRIDRRTFLGLTTGAAAIGLAGCSESARGPAGTGRGEPVRSEGGPKEPSSLPGRYGGSMTAMSLGDPKTFNLWLSTDATSTQMAGMLYDSLTWRNPYTLEFEGRLAEMPEISRDGLVYTYRLREGLLWSDGYPLTADDVLFTLDVLFDEKIDTSWREGLLIDIPLPDGSIRREPFGYKKLDPRTVEFRLPVRYAPAQSTFALNVMPRHRLGPAYRAGKFNTTWGTNTPPAELASSGPWVMAEYVPGQRVVYRRNPHFWRRAPDGRPLPYLDEFVYLVVRDLNAMALKFRSEEADVFDLRPTDYPSLKRAEAGGNYTIFNRGMNWGFEYLSLNMNPSAKVDPNTIALFQDVRFRRALSHAVNRQRIVDDLLLGFGVPLYGPETPANRLFYNPDIPKYPYDPARARALLAEIGLRDDDGNGFLEYRGREVRFNILTNVETPRLRAASTYSRSRTDSTMPRTTRAIPAQPTSERMATIMKKTTTGFRFGGSSAASASSR